MDLQRHPIIYIYVEMFSGLHSFTYIHVFVRCFLLFNFGFVPKNLKCPIGIGIRRIVKVIFLNVLTLLLFLYSTRCIVDFKNNFSLLVKTCFCITAVGFINCTRLAWSLGTLHALRTS